MPSPCSQVNHAFGISHANSWSVYELRDYLDFGWAEYGDYLYCQGPNVMACPAPYSMMRLMLGDNNMNHTHIAPYGLQPYKVLVLKIGVGEGLCG